MLGQSLLEILWFLLPAGVANTVPVFAARWNWVPSLAVPLDGGAMWAGKRILGETKTVRGFILGILFGSVVGYLQHLAYAYSFIQSIAFMPYDRAIDAGILGAFLGFGALGGDAVKSFFKRRLGVASGQQWIVFDQIDFVIGALVVGWFVAPLRISHVIGAVVVFGFLSLLTSFIGAALKIKKSL